MSLLLSALLTFTAAQPTALPLGPFDGDWTILGIERDGKKSPTYLHTTVRNGRLVLNADKGAKPVNLELAADHVAWLWSGPSKTVWVPADEVWEKRRVEDGEMLEKVVITPAHEKTVAQQGFYVEEADVLRVFFVSPEGGPSLVLTMRRESTHAHASK